MQQIDCQYQMTFHFVTEQTPSLQKNQNSTCQLGIDSGNNNINCQISLSDKIMRYQRTTHQILQALNIETKRKSWAMGKLMEHVCCSRQGMNPISIPEQLVGGNQKAIPLFLRQLKQQKVESYIKLKLQSFKGSFKTKMGMHKALSKCICRRMSQTLTRIRLYADYKYEPFILLKDMQNSYSSSKKPLRSISITYTKIIAKSDDDSRTTRSVQGRHTCKTLQRGKQKRYLFEFTGASWRRFHL